MSHLPDPTLFAAFAAASLVLAATPGPGVVYVVTRTLAQGRRAGLASLAGVALGNFGNALAASLGLAALLAISSLAFDIVRFTGAAYLVWLGVRALRAKPIAAATIDAAAAEPPPGRSLRDGFVVALLNPKTALFFGAFLPQFIDPHAPAVLQSVALGAAFVAIAGCTDTAYVMAAGAAAPALNRIGSAARLGRYLTASVYFGLGVWAALAAGPSGR